MIGIQQDAYVLAFNQPDPEPWRRLWYEKDFANFGAGFPWNERVVYIGQSTLVVDKLVVLKYVESWGTLLMDNSWGLSGVFFSAHGWTCPVLLGTPVSATYLEGIRLQGLQSQSGLIERPVISPSTHAALPCELGALMVYQKDGRQDLWEGLGIAVCSATLASFTEEPAFPLQNVQNCIGMNSLPHRWVLQPASAAAYLRSQPGVIRRLHAGQLASGFILAFDNGTCFELPYYGVDWSRIEGLRMSLVGFTDCVIPNESSETVNSYGTLYTRLGFLRAPMAVFP